MEMISQLYAPTALPHERNAATVEKEAGLAQETVRIFRRREFIFPLPGFKPRIFQPVAQ